MHGATIKKMKKFEFRVFCNWL